LFLRKRKEFGEEIKTENYFCLIRKEKAMKYKSFRKFDLFFFVVTVILILIFAVFAKAQNDQTSALKIAASGGAFTLEKAVAAGGGAAKQEMPLNEHGTTGQSIAGIKSSGGQFSLYGGFWTLEEFAPTAGGVTVGGRVKTEAGRGIRNVKIIVTFSSGETRETVSSISGFYQFTDVPAGETCVFSVSAGRYVFSEPTQVRNITDDIHNIDFVAEAVKGQKSGPASP
jgi:hypothetical protein